MVAQEGAHRILDDKAVTAHIVRSASSLVSIQSQATALGLNKDASLPNATRKNGVVVIFPLGARLALFLKQAGITEEAVGTSA